MAEVGKLSIGIEGDTSKLEKDVAAAKQKIDSSGTGGVADAGEKAAAKAAAARAKEVEQLGVVGAKLKDVKKTYGEQIEVVQGLIGKIAAVGAVAATFYKIGESISTYVIDRLKTASETVAEFSAALDRTDAKQASRKVADQLGAVNAQIADATSGWTGFVNTVVGSSPGLIKALFYSDPEKLKEQQKKLNDELKGFSNKVSGDAKKAEDDKAKAVGIQQMSNLQQLSSMTRSAMKESMSEEEQIRAEAEEKKLAISAAYVKLSAEQRKAVEAETLAAIEAINKQTEDKIAEAKKKRDDEQAKILDQLDEQGRAGRQRIDDEQQKRREQFEDFQAQMAEMDRKAAEAAKKVQESWSNAFRAIREENNRAFATDQAASMVQFAQQMKLEGMIATANMNRIVVEGVG